MGLPPADGRGVGMTTVPERQGKAARVAL
ncbi:hypothetical protein CBM2626_B150019 [Cupriavidus taiwanensis]|nr:hypothetical protein CBM2626_B150019 [Cupriavidus taiwanensis]